MFFTSESGICLSWWASSPPSPEFITLLPLEEEQWLANLQAKLVAQWKPKYRFLWRQKRPELWPTEILNWLFLRSLSWFKRWKIKQKANCSGYFTRQAGISLELKHSLNFRFAWVNECRAPWWLRTCLGPFESGIACKLPRSRLE